MKKQFENSEFFRFNLRERNSIFLLLAILGLILLIYFLTYSIPSIRDYTILPMNVADTPNQIVSMTTNSIEEENNTISEESFDPNLVSYNQLIQHGVPPKVATTWVKFVSKGARFYKPEDILKIYGVHEALYLKLKPFIVFGSKKSVEQLQVPTKSMVPLIDPNLADFDQLLSIGLPHQTAATLINYRKTGAVFYSIDDLRKVRSMNDSLIDLLESKIKFPVASASLPSAGVSSPEFKINKKEFKIDLNTADSSELVKLYGIGSKLAVRILKYRDNLGGFHSLNQLKEVYSLPDSTIQKNLEYLFLTPKVKKLKVNNLDFTKVYHPYIDKKQASIIQNYIHQHRPIHSIQDLKQIVALDHEFWNKLEPYLDFSTEQTN